MKLAVLILQIALIVIGEVKTSTSSDGDVQEDILLPYQRSHDDPKRNIRHVRECQHIIHGNDTYESYKGDNSTDRTVLQYFKYLSHNFKHKTSPFHIKKKLVHGHVALINNPLQTLSVLYPQNKMTCNEWSGIRQTVSDTAKEGQCIFAINAGFFNTHTAGCLGNIISNGKLVHDSNGIQNANFGIRRDGSIVTGYLSEDDVTESENPFVQLVSGVGWLIRNGQIYLNESKKAECADTEETGTIERFFNVVSARSAIGHDQEGKIIILTIDGKTDIDGVNLLELAQIMKDHGAVNAINLDGGGSATFAVNGTVVNYPSDTCGKDYSCERKVSTVVCIHSQANKHCKGCRCTGEQKFCVDGVCKCKSTGIKNNEGETVLEERSSRVNQGNEKESDVVAKKEKAGNKNLLDQSFGGVWFLSLTAVLGCSLLMNIFLLVVLRVSKKKQQKPWRQGDLRGLLDDDSDGI